MGRNGQTLEGYRCDEVPPSPSTLAVPHLAAHLETASFDRAVPWCHLVPLGELPKGSDTGNAKVFSQVLLFLGACLLFLSFSFYLFSLFSFILDSLLCFSGLLILSLRKLKRLNAVAELRASLEDLLQEKLSETKCSSAADCSNLNSHDCSCAPPHANNTEPVANTEEASSAKHGYPHVCSKELPKAELTVSCQ